jgi:hypothetical protein
MPNFQCRWTPKAEQKPGDNFVTAEQFEQVVRKARNVIISRSSGRPACVGRIGNRVLFCVFEFVDELTIQPVTAFWIRED